MNWEAIGAIGQVLGSVAVFVTLGYLAVQVKHARQTGQRALSQGRGEALRELFNQKPDERMNGLLMKADAAFGGQVHPFVEALIERAGMTEEEAMLTMLNLVLWWNYFIQIIPNADELPPMERHQFEVPLRNYGRPGVFRLFYETYIKEAGHPDAVRYIDNLLAQPR